MPTTLMHLPSRRKALVLETGKARWCPGSVTLVIGHACFEVPLQFKQLMMTLLHRVMVVNLAQRARRRCVACVETRKQARALIMIDTHGHKFLGVVLCLEEFRVGCRGG